MNSEYPSDEDLETVAGWSMEDPSGWFAFIRSIWWMPDWGWHTADTADEPNRLVMRHSIATGGWSGNEEILGAMAHNWLWGMTWVESRRGGHHVFEVVSFPASHEGGRG